MLRPPIKIIVAFVITSFSGCKKEGRETELPIYDTRTSYPSDSAFEGSQVAPPEPAPVVAPERAGERKGKTAAQKLGKAVCALFLNHDSTTVTLNLADENKRMLPSITLRPGYDAEVKPHAYYAWIDPEEVSIITCRNRYEIKGKSIYRLVAIGSTS